MLAPHLRKKVDKLWDRFWSAGLTNPLVAVEQITYLLFLKRLEYLDEQRVNARKPSIYAQRLPGDPPDPRNLTSGCSFAPRCPRAAEVCLPAEPELASYDGDRAAACFRIDRPLAKPGASAQPGPSDEVAAS